jgi:hypothetical protein
MFDILQVFAFFLLMATAKAIDVVVLKVDRFIPILVGLSRG